MSKQGSPHSSARITPLTRRDIIVGVPAAVGFGPTTLVSAARHAGRRSRYELQLVSIRRLRFLVRADVPIKGDRLNMSDTYPAELPAMAGKGWPALISDLIVSDLNGHEVGVAEQVSNGWRLERPIFGRARLRYSVDFGIFDAAGWPSPLESALVDADHAVVSCRALFITTSSSADANVGFQLPGGWQAIAPWPASNSQNFFVRSLEDLTDNMLVVSRERPEIVSAAGFTIQLVTMGHWKPLHSLAKHTLRTIIALEVGMMQFRQRETYSVILIPTLNTAGAAYRESFVYCFGRPSADNLGAWANTLAHEIFHYWNYARLVGQDYATTQWFQEGFTEYVANLTLLVGKIASPKWFLSKLSEHVVNYGHLTTSLENIGSKKGKPLYSAGALTAFSFDVMIRHSTAGRSTIGTFFRHLWRYTRGGARRYSWRDIEASLRATAPGNWEVYYERYIRGHEPLPIEQACRLAGLQLFRTTDGFQQVVLDSSAPADTKMVWSELNSTI